MSGSSSAYGHRLIQRPIYVHVNYITPSSPSPTSCYKQHCTPRAGQTIRSHPVGCTSILTYILVSSKLALLIIGISPRMPLSKPCQPRSRAHLTMLAKSLPTQQYTKRPSVNSALEQMTPNDGYNLQRSAAESERLSQLNKLLNRYIISRLAMQKLHAIQYR